MSAPLPRLAIARLLTGLVAVCCGPAGLIAIARAQDMGFPIVTAFSSVEIGTDARSWVTVQDPDGVLHFGCDVLASYDGERWRTTPLRDAYALRGLDFGADGRLWFAAAGDIGWFERQEGAQWRLHSLRASLPPDLVSVGEVWHVFAENHGAVFVSHDKILRWDGVAFQVWSLPGSRRLPATRCAGIIYVHHELTGLYALGANGPKLVIPAAVLGNAMVFWMESRADGWLLATSQGMFVFSDGQLAPFAPAVSEYVKGNALTSAVRLPDGRLALGTYRGGLVFMRADGTLDRVLTENDGLPTRAIYSVFVDREGSLWVTSPSHIFRVAAASPSALFDRRAGLPELPVLKIVRHQGTIMAATDRGVFQLESDGRRFLPIDDLHERLLELRSTEGGLLVANYRDVKLVSAGNPTTLFTSDQTPCVVQPSRRWPGSMLISSGRNIVVLDAGGRARTVIRDLPDIATSMAEDNSGRIWLGTYARGILSAQPESDTPVEAVPAAGSRGLPIFSGQGIVVAAANDAVIAFTSGGGWIKGPDARNFEPIADYPRRDLAVVSDAAADGNVWIVHPTSEGRPACLARIAVAGSHATWQPHSVEGLSGIGVPRSILAEVSAPGSTVLWIGGTNGILRSAATAGPVAPAPRPPLLHAFARSAERDAPELIAGALPYSTRSILFEFAAPDFSRRSALRLETMVEGIDPGWFAAGPDARRELTAVREGAYTFRVRTVAETGIASAPAVFHFSILPPWWRTPPAMAGALLALAAVIYGGYRMRVGALRRQNAALEAKVRQRTGQLAQASAAKTQFVANMSHDIRNPLNGIVGLALALEDTRLDDRQREIVATLRECTTYLSSLVDDVLDFATIESGRIELRPGPFVPAELLRSVVATLRADAVQSGATLTVAATPDVPPVLLGDAGRIQQILVNYVTNALKYAGGHIRLAASVPLRSTDEVEFSVTDEGAGFSEAEQAVLFTKFTRLPNGCSEPIKGAGLGLASCRLLADIMGGSVGVESRAGHGARFFLRLPLAVSTAAPPPVAAEMLPQASVLVVEDVDYNAWAATAVLSKLGLTNHRVRTGREALQCFAERRFNIVLLDRNLPDMDGTDVARQMRALEVDGAPAIILAVTAYCTAEDRARCLEAGMDAFVGKPLTPEKLRKILIAAGRRLLTAASVHAPPDAHTPALNLSLLGYLSDGTEQGLATQIERFLAALADAEDHLARVAAERDFAALGDAAHRVLSQAKLIGCAALENAAVALERAARARQAATFAEFLPRVHREIAALTEALHGRHHAAPSG